MFMTSNRPPASNDEEKKGDRGDASQEADDKAVKDFQYALATVKRVMNQMAKGYDKR